jgi:hypothetical protein
VNWLFKQCNFTEFKLRLEKNWGNPIIKEKNFDKQNSKSPSEGDYPAQEKVNGLGG